MIDQSVPDVSGQVMTSANPSSGELPVVDYGSTHPLRPFALAAGMSVALFSLSALILFLMLRTAQIATRIDPLAMYTLCVVALWSGSVVIMFARPPSAEQAVLIWGRNARILIWSLHLAVAWLIWGILPFVGIANQYYATVFLVVYVPTQIISSPENTGANRAGIIIVLGSAAIFLATRQTIATSLLASYVACFAALMFVLSDKVLRTVQAAVTQRLASDAAARDLDRLLAIVSSERDAKTRFIAAASHDLGQPLQAAALFFDQTQRAVDDESRARAVDGVHRAFASTEQLLAHMLNHLRLEADQVVPQRSHVSLPALLGRIAAQYAAAAERAGIRLSTASAMLTLLLDPVLIDRALGNLVQNAIDHSRATRVLLVARHHGADAVRLWVIDNGVGVGRSDAKLIFDDYYQGPRAAGERPSGFGLGLASARRIATVMQGSAGIDLRWLSGSAFFVEFPRGHAVQGGAR